MYKSTHRAQEVISALQNAQLLVDANVDAQTTFTSVSFDTREIEADALFAIKGRHFKPEYVAQAAKAGAVVFVFEQRHEVEAAVREKYPFICVTDIRLAMALIARIHTNNADKAFDLVGITGTKGKTTTSFFVKSIFDAASPGLTPKESCGISSTVVYYDGTSYKGATLTTPEAFTLFDILATARDNKLEQFVMEVSSQALKYQRTEGIRFKVGCIINIGLDHISENEHPSFEDYLASKLRIYSQSETGIVNLDSDYATEMYAAALSNCKQVITYSTKDAAADYYAHSEHINSDGKVAFTAVVKGDEFEVVLGTAGFFNVSNALAALAITDLYSISREAQLAGLLASRIPGHMDIVKSDDNRVIACVDYAHNKISFEAIFDSFRREYPNRVIVAVYGSGGDKAKNRRKELAYASNWGADYNVITEEDPAYEGAEAVCAEIVSYLEHDTHCTIIDRESAIRHGINLVDTLVDASAEGTVVLILGKGNETYSYDKGVYALYKGDDVVMRECIACYNKQH